MSLVALEGTGIWMPSILGYLAGSPLVSSTDTMTLDATGEEAQYIGHVMIDGGGSKTFGTSSKIGWLPGTPITFATGSTLRVGVKAASKIDTAAGPPARATVGTAAFDVWDELVGGTDTITATTWRDETMSAGTPFTVTDGDLLAICFSLTVTSGTPSVKMRTTSNTGGSQNLPTQTLVTTGPTYTAVAGILNLILVFDDGTVGWLDVSFVYSASGITTAIGNGNSIANIVEVPFPCQIDTLAAYVGFTAGGDFALEILSTPLATPAVIVTLPCDANMLGAVASRVLFKRLAAPVTLAANTPYALSIKQTTATNVTGGFSDVAVAAHFKANGMGTDCYAANSTGGATFVTQNSGLRRYNIWMRISALDDGAGGEPSAGGGGSVFGAAGGVVS